jgi:hypothetical protein
MVDFRQRYAKVVASVKWNWNQQGKQYSTQIPEKTKDHVIMDTYPSVLERAERRKNWNWTNFNPLLIDLSPSVYKADWNNKSGYTQSGINPKFR